MTDQKLMPCGSHDAPIATIRYANMDDLKNEMPQVMSCIDLPDGSYEVYLRPARKEVSGEEVERVAGAFLKALPDDFYVGPGDEPTSVTIDGCGNILPAIRAAIAAMNPKPAEAASGVGGKMAIYSADELREVVRPIVEAEGGQRSFSRKHDISSSHLCEFLSGVRNPGGDLLEAISAETKYAIASLATPATEKAPEPVAARLLANELRAACSSYERHARDVEAGRAGPLFKAAIQAVERALYAHPPAADVAAMREALKPLADLVEALEAAQSFVNPRTFPGTATPVREKMEAAITRGRQALAALPEEPSA